MPLLNYTTKVPTQRSVAEIQAMLAARKVTAILTEYDSEGEVAAISFKVLLPHTELAFRLPANVEAVQKVLQRQRVRARVSKEQAVRVAWRIIKDWVEAQMALLDTEMVRMEEVFLPYLLTERGTTLYQLLASSQFRALPAPRE